MPKKIFTQSIHLIKKHYEGFGPTLANEKLLENHNIKISTETLRQWMIKEGLWNLKKEKK